MKILVLGSEGTIGRPLCKKLTTLGHEVTKADLIATKDNIRVDVSDEAQVRELFRDSSFDVCYHLAAEFGRNNGEEFFTNLIDTNIKGTRNVIKCCAEQFVDLVFASSSEIYGERTESELVESLPFSDYYHNQYAMTKVFNEWQLRMAERQLGLRATVLRICNLYGPGERYTKYRSIVCKIVHSILNDLPMMIYGNTTRKLLYIDDFINTVSQKLPVGTFNIGGNETISMLELVRKIEAILDKKLKMSLRSIDPDNITHKPISIKLAQTILKHEPVVSLDEGLARYCEWVQQ